MSFMDKPARVPLATWTKIPVLLLQIMHLRLYTVDAVCSRYEAVLATGPTAF
jgi:hypothetical protein